MSIAGLTKRQREIAHLVAEGYTNAEIAERLYIEPHSVRVTVSRIYASLDLSPIEGERIPYVPRVQLARLAWEEERQ